MTEAFSDLLAIAADSRLAQFLPSASAAFVFEPGGRQVLWGNAAGLDEAGERSLVSLRARRPELERGFAQEITRAAALAPDAEPGQLHLIRFPWGSRPVAWRARRLGAGAGWSGLFLMAADPLARRPDWPLAEALIRLFPDAPAAVLDRRGKIARASPALDLQTQTALRGPLGPALANAATADRATIIEHASPDRILRLAAIRVSGLGADAVLAILVGAEARPARPLLVSVERNPRPAARRVVSFRSDRPLIRDVSADRILQAFDPDASTRLSASPNSAGPASKSAAGDGQASAADLGRALEEFFSHSPLALLVFRDTGPLFATRAFLDLLGYSSLEAFASAGGLEPLVPDGAQSASVDAIRADGTTIAIETRLFPAPWADGPATALSVEPVRPDSSDDAPARRLGEVLAGVSREIRTPLNAMLGFSEIMFRERFGPIGDERYRGYLRDILTSGAHVLGLLDGLLELAAVEAGRGARAFEEIVVNDLVRASAALSQPLADRAQVVIRLGLARGTPIVHGDRASLQRSLQTLLANAVAVTPAGGQVIISTLIEETGAVAIRVRDVGVGPALDLAGVLAEASRARLSVFREPGLGGVAEILFPSGDRIIPIPTRDKP